MIRSLFTLLLMVVMAVPSLAQDRQFARTYQSATLPKGAMDLEAWGTYRAGREYFYRRLDTRLEFEIGLTDRLQTAFYLNGEHKAFEPNLDTLGGIRDTSMGGIFTESAFSVSSEWKWNVINPATHRFGLALYAEFTFSPTEFELENKIILDHRSEKNIFGLNVVNELEYESEFEAAENKVELEQEDVLELDFAYMRMFKPTFGLGVEIRNDDELKSGEWEYSALSGGPTLYWSVNRSFVILNVLPQWTNLKKTDDAPNHLVLNDYEKMEVRLIIGFGL